MPKPRSVALLHREGSFVEQPPLRSKRLPTAIVSSPAIVSQYHDAVRAQSARAVVHAATGAQIRRGRGRSSLALHECRMSPPESEARRDLRFGRSEESVEVQLSPVGSSSTVPSHGSSSAVGCLREMLSVVAVSHTIGREKSNRQSRIGSMSAKAPQ